MVRDEHTKRVLEEIKSSLAKSLEGFINQPVDPEKIKAHMLNYLSTVVDEDSAGANKVDLEVIPGEYDGQFQVKGKNLFTAMLLNHDYVPYDLVKDLEEYTSTKGLYKLSDGEYIFIRHFAPPPFYLDYVPKDNQNS